MPRMRMRLPLLFSAVFAGLLTTAQATDAYLSWATSKWGVNAVANSAAQNTTWGENADPDKDGLPNLIEYTADTDPTRSNPSSDCYEFLVPTTGPASSRYPQLSAWQRTDDPDLRVTCQKSSNLQSWLPEAPGNLTQLVPPNLFILTQETENFTRGLRQVRYIDLQSMASRPAAFMRLVVTRRGASATGPGIEPFTFTSQSTVLPGSLGRSNAVVLGGFTGSTTINIPTGVTLYINGIAQTGTTATVKAGDALWMEATAPGSIGIPRNYTLDIGGHSATWSFATDSIAAIPDHPGSDSGYTQVDVGVSESGAAQINIPIVVSPGTAGMQPKLSISYSSQGGNGPLGLGFSLSGISAITRVGRTVAQDGVKGGVKLDLDDRFALDGQRLTAISGTDGEGNSEYRLESDPTTRVRLHGEFANSWPIFSGPFFPSYPQSSQYWSVETKAGLLMEYGLSDKSRIYPYNNFYSVFFGDVRPLLWTIEKITDSVGNYMTFDYDYWGAKSGEPLLTSITYTANSSAGLVANQLVTFEYEDRPDNRSKYIARYQIVTSKRIRAITSGVKDSFGNMKNIMRYEMAYQQDPLTFDSQLVSVQMKRPDGSSSPATRFTWPASNATETFFRQGNATGISSSAKVDGDFLSGDFDGDGRTDVLVWNTAGYSNRFSLYRSNGSGFDTVRPTSLVGGNSTRSNPVLLGDFNGDGKTDVLAFSQESNSYKMYLSAGADFQAPVNTTIPANDAGHPHLILDADGDGRSDVAAFNFQGNLGKYTTLLSQGAGFSIGEFPYSILSAELSYYINSALYQLHLGEFNGDGMTDITTAQIVSYSSGAKILGDFNGDGLTDLIVWDDQLLSPGTYSLFECRGDGSFYPRPQFSIPGGFDSVGARYQSAVDFNGDGKADMATWNAPFSNSRLNIAISAGDGVWSDGTGLGVGFGAASATAISNANALNMSGDFNGDGKTDMLVWGSPSANQFNLWLNEGPPPRLVQRVTNGHGGYTQFGYKMLTDESVHTKGTGLTFPYYSLQAPLAVVSSVISSNGIDGDPFTGIGAPGVNTVTYHYKGAWSSLDGRGFQGFKEVESTDVTSGVVNRTVYESSSPLLAGRPKHSEQRLLVTPPGGSSLISESDSTWDLVETTHPTGRKTYFVGEASSVAKSYETNRPSATALVKTTTRSGPASNGGKIRYDVFANPIEITTTTTDGVEVFTERVVNTFTDAPTPSQWYLGRLSASSVIKTAPGGETATRNSTFQYHPTTGLLTQEVIEPNGGLLRQQKDYVHDGFGNIFTSTFSTPGQASRTTTTFYTPDGRFVRETRNAKNHAETKTYDPLLGNVLTQTGPNGLTTTWEYDALGRPTRAIRPDGTQTRSFYRRVTGSTTGAPPRAVHYVRVHSSGGSPKTVWYDLLNREIRADSIAFDGRTVSSHKVFNNRGEVTHASQPYFEGDTPLYSTMSYDAVGRETQQIDPGNRTTTTVHNGLTTSVTNPRNQTVSTVANAMGWTLRSTDAAGKSIHRTYDAYGALRFITDPAGNTTELRYDQRGNKTWMSEPNCGVSFFTYNGFGELKTQTNNANQTVSLTYDMLGRVLTRSEPEGVTTFEYDSAAKGIGQLVRESIGDFVRSYFFDHLSRSVNTVEKHGFHSFAVSRSYDSYGRPDAITYPTGFATRQYYTDNGYLREVRNAANDLQSYWQAGSVNARGQITKEIQGNLVVTNRTFDANTGLITSITSSFGGIGDVQKAEFDFDLIGNLTARRDKRYRTTFSETFGYDTLNRLQTVTTTGTAAVTAVYNDLGNITSRTDVGSFSYGAASTGPHALIGVTGGAFNKSCGYDAKGNRTTDGATSLTYSSFNKPVRMVKGGDTLHFDYGPDSALYRQTTFLTQSGGATSQTVREYIGGLYERETTSEGLVRHIHYIAGGSGVTAILTDERSSASPTERLRYIHKDHLGSVDVITGRGGAVVERQSFDAWGRRRTVAYNSGTSTWSVSYPATPGSAETHRGFTGHEMLDAVGLVHMGGRVYDPITARFLSPDPFVQSPDNLQNLNRYSYVLNNPMSFTDPSGFFFKSIGKFFKENWKTIAVVAVGVATGGAAIWAAGFASGIIAGSTAMLTGSLSIGAAALGGAGFGFGSAFSGTLLAGGSVGDALRAGLTGGAIGGLSAGLTHGAASQFGLHGLKTTQGDFYEKLAIKVAAHGSIQGGMAELQGGQFRHGFLSGAFSAASSPSIAAHVGESYQVAASAVVGGTSSSLSGGKFSNGAVTGAFVYLFNQCAAEAESTCVGAVRAGTVSRAGWQDPKNHRVGFGWRIIVDEGDGYGSIYGHLDPSTTPKVGDTLNVGDDVGNYADPTNGSSTGPHVHLQYFQNGNPRDAINPGGLSPLSNGKMSAPYGQTDSVHQRPHKGEDWIAK